VILEVNVSVDDILLGKAVSKQPPLYVIAWQPELYKSGIHTLTVQVKVSFPL